MLSRSLLGCLLALPLALNDVDGCQEPTPTPIPEPSSCIVTGCSGQVCASEPVMTTCEYTCEYGCYQYATCEAQAAGLCGWTSSPEFDACMDRCKGL